MENSREAASKKGRSLPSLRPSQSTKGANFGAFVRPSSGQPSHVIPPPQIVTPQCSTNLSPGISSPGVPISGSYSDGIRNLYDESLQSSISGTNRRLDGQGGKAFDCPIRAGPDGQQLCGWRPKDGTGGFPSLARVREHVGSHGLQCRDCNQTFTKPTRFKDHRKLREKGTPCLNAHADQKPCKFSILRPPDVFEAFFKRPSKQNKADQEAWLEDYKILHPDWHRQGPLPSSSYTENIARENTGLFRRASASVAELETSSTRHTSNHPATVGMLATEVSQELSYSSSSPRRLFSAGSPQEPMDISTLTRGSIVDLVASNTNDYIQGCNQLPVFDGPPINYLGSLPIGTLGHEQISGSHSLQQPQEQDSLAQYDAHASIEPRNLYWPSVAQSEGSIDPVILQDYPTSSTISTYVRSPSHTTSQRPPLSLQSTTASSAYSESAQQANQEIKALLTQLNMSKTKLQKANTRIQNLKHQKEGLERETIKLGSILDLIHHDVIEWKTSHTVPMDANDRFGAINHSMHNIEEHLKQRHDENVDVEMLDDSDTVVANLPP